MNAGVVGVGRAGERGTLRCTYIYKRCVIHSARELKELSVSCRKALCYGEMLVCWDPFGAVGA